MNKQFSKIYVFLDDKKDEKEKPLPPQTKYEFNQEEFINLNERKYGVYCSVNSFDLTQELTEKTYRCEKYLSNFDYAYADLDIAKHGDGQTDEQKRIKKEEKLKEILPFKPTKIIETANGYQAYWKISDGIITTESKIKYSGIISSIINKFNGDPGAKDMSRILRLPKFYHNKGEPFLCKLVHESEVVYTLNELAKIFPFTEKEAETIKSKVDFWKALEDGFPDGSRHSAFLSLCLSMLRGKPKKDWERVWILLESTYHQKAKDTKGFSIEDAKGCFDQACKYRSEWDSNLKIDEAKIEQTDLGFFATLLESKGYLYFDFSEIFYDQKAIDCLCTISFDISMGNITPFATRINLLSPFADKELVLKLNSCYGGKKDQCGFNWQLIINNIFNAVISAVRESQKVSYVTDMEYKPTEFMLYPFLQSNAPNMIFSQPEIGKSFLALRLGISQIAGIDFLGFKCEGGKRVLYIDYEDTKNVFSTRLYMVCKGLGIAYKDIAANFPHLRLHGSIKDNIGIIKRHVVTEKIDLVIIDSASRGSGGSPNDESLVLNLYDALPSIPATILLIHHEPKDTSGKDKNSYYGSQFWRAGNRVAWRMELESEIENIKIIKMTINKKSNMGNQKPIYYEQRFILPEMPNEIPAIIIKLTEYTPSNYGDMTAADIVIKFLEDNGPSAPKIIAEKTKQKPGTIRSAITRLVKDKMIEKDDKGNYFL